MCMYSTRVGNGSYNAQQSRPLKAIHMGYAMGDPLRWHKVNCAGSVQHQTTQPDSRWEMQSD